MSQEKRVSKTIVSGTGKDAGPVSDAPASTTVAELVAEFWKHAEAHHRRTR